MHNPYRNTQHRAAFDDAVSLYQSGITDYLQISKRLSPTVPRYKRQAIAAKVCRLMRQVPTPGENMSKWLRFCKNVESTPNHVESVRN